jgi:hypothetical protein
MGLGHGEAKLIEETTAKLADEGRKATSKVALFKNLLMEAASKTRICFE